MSPNTTPDKVLVHPTTKTTTQCQVPLKQHAHENLTQLWDAALQAQNAIYDMANETNTTIAKHINAHQTKAPDMSNCNGTSTGRWSNVLQDFHHQLQSGVNIIDNGPPPHCNNLASTPCIQSSWIHEVCQCHLHQIWKRFCFLPSTIQCRLPTWHLSPSLRLPPISCIYVPSWGWHSHHHQLGVSMRNLPAMM